MAPPVGGEFASESAGVVSAYVAGSSMLLGQAWVPVPRPREGPWASPERAVDMPDPEGPQARTLAERPCSIEDGRNWSLIGRPGAPVSGLNRSSGLWLGPDRCPLRSRRSCRVSTACHQDTQRGPGPPALSPRPRTLWHLQRDPQDWLLLSFAGLVPGAASRPRPRLPATARAPPGGRTQTDPQAAGIRTENLPITPGRSQAHGRPNPAPSPPRMGVSEAPQESFTEQGGGRGGWGPSSEPKVPQPSWLSTPRLPRRCQRAAAPLCAPR
nr:uncharacterized protein LOC105483934 [Macaca nemestrina]